MLLRNNLVVASPVIVFLQGIKCDIFVKRSTTTRIESNLFEIGRPVIKSINRDVQGLLGICSGFKSPCGRWRIHLVQKQILQDLT
jgi:hypothetical protein